ncbi:unnamed protein product [Symbiodinium microadriaticum]|nr:unnamed protein product [Symbiodinium microadriaticum]
MWQDFDKDGSGILEREEVDSLLKHIWKTYQVQKPLSPDVVRNVLEELDKSKDGKIVQAEFEDLYDDLWEEMSQMYAACLALLAVGIRRLAVWLRRVPLLPSQSPRWAPQGADSR